MTINCSKCSRPLNAVECAACVQPAEILAPLLAVDPAEYALLLAVAAAAIRWNGDFDTRDWMVCAALSAAVDALAAFREASD